MAAKPSDWNVMGVVCGPREVDPAVRSPDEWCAWARGPNKERVEGRGASPEDALTTLAFRPEGGPRVKLRGIVPALLIGALSGCALLPPSTIDMPLEAQQHCGFPEGTTLVFARDGVTLQEMGLAANDPNPAANPRGTVYVTAQELPLVGTDGARARCIVFEDPSGTLTGSVGAVPDDWTPP